MTNTNKFLPRSLFSAQVTCSFSPPVEDEAIFLFLCRARRVCCSAASLLFSLSSSLQRRVRGSFEAASWYHPHILLHILFLVLHVSIGLVQAEVLILVFLWTLLRGFLQHVAGFLIFWIRMYRKCEVGKLSSQQYPPFWCHV